MNNNEELNDSFIFDEIDDTLASLDSSFLKKARKEIIKNNGDTEVIDKAIEERKRRDKIIEKEERQNKKIIRDAAIIGIASGLISNKKTSNHVDLMSSEKDLVSKGEYEPYQFEEQEFEDDDYYYDDLD